MGSLDFALDKNDQYDRNIVNVLVKTVFTNKDVLKKLKQDYAEKLEGKEKVLYCKMDMQYKMKEKTYTVKTMQVFTNKDRQIDEKKNKNKSEEDQMKKLPFIVVIVDELADLMVNDKKLTEKVENVHRSWTM